MDDGLIDPGTAAMLAAAEAGQDVARRLNVGGLAPGDVGVLEITVSQVGPGRPYRRRRGGEGLLCRVTLEDGTGQVDLVLWDDEVRHAGTTFLPAALLRIRGATVRPGHRGGVELALGSAVIEPRQAADHTLRGVLAALGATRIVGMPPAERFTAEAAFLGPEGPSRLVLWDAALRDARSILPGTDVEVAGARPHPQLEGWWIADGGARIRPAGKPS